MPDQTTKLLLEAASEEFIEHGYAGARVAEVGRRAGMTTGAIYSRWPRKPDLFVAALEHALQEISLEHMLEQYGAADTGPREAFEVLGAHLLSCTERRPVLFHAFASARNNEDLRPILARFLNAETDKMRRIIDDAKAVGLADPELCTVAMSVLCHAIGIGIVMLMSAGLEDRNKPAEQDWNKLLARLLDCAAPSSQRPCESPDTQTQTPDSDATA